MGSGEWDLFSHSPFPIPHSPFPTSRNNFHRSSRRNQIKQLFYLVVFERDASWRPIPTQSEHRPGSAAMNKDVSAESGVLRRLRLGADGADDRLMLGLCDQSLFQPFVGVGDVGVADAQREVEFASRVFVRDV